MGKECGTGYGLDEEGKTYIELGGRKGGKGDREAKRKGGRVVKRGLKGERIRGKGKKI